MMEEVGSAVRLGAIVRRRRLEVGITQERLAQAAGVSAKTVVTLEMGRSEGIRFDKLRAILDAIDLAVFVDRKPEPSTMTYGPLYASLMGEVIDGGDVVEQ